MSEHGKAGSGVGARHPRKEDDRLMRGRGQYVGDMSMPGMMEVAFLRSSVAHGRIRSITKPAGREGAVFIREDMVEAKAMRTPVTLPGYKASDYGPLAHRKVRHVGEPVAMGIAATRAAAEDLVELIDVDLEELPALTDSLVARNSPIRVHDEWSDNLFLTTSVDTGLDEPIRKASVVVKREYRMARQAMNPMEGKAILACWDHRLNQLVVFMSTQVPHLIRTGLSEHLGIAQGSIRVVAPDVGGGFGYKCVLHPEELSVAWLALKFRKPFRWTEDRREHLISGANSRQHHYYVTAYADDKGKLLAFDAEVSIDAGAYSAWPFSNCAEAGQIGGNLPGPYVFSGYRCNAYTVATNKPGFLPYRGVARTGVCFAMELTIDAIARAVGREPWEVRCENLVPASAMPYTNVTRKDFDSGDWPRSLRMAVENIDLPAIRAKQRQPRPDGKLIGVGFATYTEQTAHGTSVLASWGLPIVPGFEAATVRVTPDGGLEVRVGVHSHGQGMETTMAQIAHEVLGVDTARINVIHGDTSITPYSTGTYASRSITMAGGAVSSSCKALAPRLITIGAHLLKCAAGEARLENGRVVGPEGGITIAEIANVWYLHPQRVPADADLGGLEATVSYKPTVDTGAFSYASHAAVVAVDPKFGSVEILDYVIVEDCGVMVNPMIVEGQTYGGTAQGIGTALYEEMPFDANGQPLASTFADYLMPGSMEIPHLRMYHMETPSPHTEFGIKGVGEGGAIAPPAVIFNAVNDALRELGAEVNETPLTPRRLLAAIARAREPVPRRSAATHEVAA